MLVLEGMDYGGSNTSVRFVSIIFSVAVTRFAAELRGI